MSLIIPCCFIPSGVQQPLNRILCEEVHCNNEGKLKMSCGHYVCVDFLNRQKIDPEEGTFLCPKETCKKMMNVATEQFTYLSGTENPQTFSFKEIKDKLSMQKKECCKGVLIGLFISAVIFGSVFGILAISE